MNNQSTHLLKIKCGDMGSRVTHSSPHDPTGTMDALEKPHGPEVVEKSSPKTVKSCTTRTEISYGVTAQHADPLECFGSAAVGPGGSRGTGGGLEIQGERVSAISDL